MASRELAHDADLLDGLLARQCRIEEYEHLIEAGLLRRSYRNLPALFGLATLVRVEPATAH